MMLNKMNPEELTRKSKEIRQKVIAYRKATRTPHVGSDLSCVEILTTLYYHAMREEDSFILSKGHAVGTLYAILHDTGKIPEQEYFKLEEHPTRNPDYGIEVTSGSLGHGLSIGLGMALADKRNRIYVLLGDGECDEGQVWEAARTTSELGVSNLIAIVDCNGWQGLKPADHLKLDRRFEAFGWTTQRCNGHDCFELIRALELRDYKSPPYVILANTVKAKGLPELEDTLKSHYMVPK